jgi:threonine dehydrogenase-like Zn-dependent dehydrogenase
MCNGFDRERPRNGDVVVVQGVGPLGIFAVALAKASGASKVIVIGGTELRLEICKEMGADVLLNRNATSEEERRQKIMDLTYGRGADFVVEAVGYSEAVAEGLNLVRRGGTYLSAGFGQPMGEITFDPFRHLDFKNLKIQGVWVSDTTHVYQAMHMILQNPASFGKIITHRYPLARADEALERMHKKQAVKAVLTGV